jgi:hypothetical protein
MPTAGTSTMGRAAVTTDLLSRRPGVLSGEGLRRRQHGKRHEAGRGRQRGGTRQADSRARDAAAVATGEQHEIIGMSEGGGGQPKIDCMAAPAPRAECLLDLVELLRSEEIPRAGRHALVHRIEERVGRGGHARESIAQWLTISFDVTPDNLPAWSAGWQHAS